MPYAKNPGRTLNNVLLSHTSQGADIGTFTVVPEIKQVHYQRRNGAFAQQAANIFDWEKVSLQREQNLQEQKIMWV